LLLLGHKFWFKNARKPISLKTLLFPKQTWVKDSV